MLSAEHYDGRKFLLAITGSFATSIIFSLYLFLLIISVNILICMNHELWLLLCPFGLSI